MSFLDPKEVLQCRQDAENASSAATGRQLFMGKDGEATSRPSAGRGTHQDEDQSTGSQSKARFQHPDSDLLEAALKHVVSDPHLRNLHPPSLV